MSTAVAILNREAIIAKVAEGQRLTDIAKPLGVSAQAISKALINDPEYQAARLEGHSSRLDEAESEISSAAEQVDVARARAYWSAVSWRAEREHPAQYAPRQHITASIAVTSVDALLVNGARELLQHEPVGVTLGVTGEALADE